jgi:fructan beta-fructosidase
MFPHHFKKLIFYMNRGDCLLIFFAMLNVLNSASNKIFAQTIYHEQYRPQVHFSPKENWVNDPNGMVYYEGIYHLFFQHHPNSTNWGPMHWGHATSSDLIHWTQQPIAIFPDSLGTIFSGSAVVDKNNSSGFGRKGKAPLVAIFTQHDVKRMNEGRNDFQNQSIAFSNDNGKSWTKYTGNPVVKNPGLRDFRDPKVLWYEPQKKWVMSLAAKNKIVFYSSVNLKNWEKESEFGEGIGAHGGGWECPDLFMIDDSGKKRWVLIVNLNPGGPNAGSGTQYFIGDFNGNKFTTDQQDTRWIDFGPDNYAGVTWSNTGKRNILIGWMSNWLYANQVPTIKWRNAMTLPRDLKLMHVGNEVLLTSKPVSELSKIQSKPIVAENILISDSADIAKKTGKLKFPCRINLYMDAGKDFSLVFSNSLGQKLVIGYDMLKNQYFIDRTNSGKTDFQKDFAARHFAPRFITDNKINLSIILDESSVELFADDGLTVMTEVFFPDVPFDKSYIHTKDKVVLKKIEYLPLKSIWK